MADTKQTESTTKEESQASSFNFPCGDLEEMLKMMQNSCCSEGSFNCCEMMQKMCGGTPKEPEK